MRPVTVHRQSGFTLIELLIVVAIVGILAVLATPQYQKYTKKAKFAEVVNAVAPFKLGVEECFINTADLDDCDAGSNGVPAAVTVASGYVASVGVADGVITATAIGSSYTAASGLNGETLVLTPTAGAAGASAVLTWAKTGGCTAAAIC
jgi:type IV pilus assembly protein PilA